MKQSGVLQLVDEKLVPEPEGAFFVFENYSHLIKQFKEYYPKVLIPEKEFEQAYSNSCVLWAVFDSKVFLDYNIPKVFVYDNPTSAYYMLHSLLKDVKERNNDI